MPPRSRPDDAVALHGGLEGVVGDSGGGPCGAITGGHERPFPRLAGGRWRPAAAERTASGRWVARPGNPPARDYCRPRARGAPRRTSCRVASTTPAPGPDHSRPIGDHRLRRCGERERAAAVGRHFRRRRPDAAPHHHRRRRGGVVQAGHPPPRCRDRLVHHLREVRRRRWTWRDNTYRRLTATSPGHLYSFSSAPKRDWTRRFAGQPEILGYF